MKQLLEVLRYWFCSGHRFVMQAEPAGPVLCRARELCLGCDGRDHCYLAKQVSGKK